MSNYYKQPITVFGAVIPLCLIAVLTLVAFFGWKKVDGKFKEKKVTYDKAQKAIAQKIQLQGVVAKNAPTLDQWQNNISTETRGTFIDHWKATEQKFKGVEFTRSSHKWTDFSSGIGKGVNQPASQIEMNFSASFRAMQLAMMEMETKLPQMQLDSLTITPDNSGKRLNFKTTHTIWNQN